MRQLLSRKSNTPLHDEETKSSRPSVSVPQNNFEWLPDHSSKSFADIIERFPSTKSGGWKLHSDHQGALTNDGRQTPRRSRSDSGSRLERDERKISERSQLFPTRMGPPKVLTGGMDEKSRLTYRRCEDEPIHTPGAVQNFGALVAVKYGEHGLLEVRITSENSRKILGYGPEQLFELPSFLDILQDEIREEMVARINHAIREGSTEDTRLDIFQVVLTYPFEPDTRLWCALHLAPGSEGLVICEFEEYLDAFRRDAEIAKMLPVKPVHLGYEVPEDELKKSTVSASKPLLGVEITRQKQKQQFSTLDLFNIMNQAQKQIVGCKSLHATYEVVVGLISELTGFHRVMFYRFDPQKHGLVEAELLDPRASTDAYRGLHFPASDIPKQARELYKLNRIRLLHNREADTARLVCRSDADFEQPLDLTHAYLRAMSPAHHHYLENIGVRSTMSISIVIDSDLWGLIACHGYGELGMRVSLPIRELCRNIGDCTAVQIQRLLTVQRMEARRLPVANPYIEDPADVLALVNADFAMLSIDDTARPIGKPEPYDEALAITSYLQSCRFTQVRSSQNIKADFPGLSYPPGLSSICGLLLVPLSFGDGNDFLVFFRKGQQKQMTWAGNPYEKKYRPGTDYLEPRASFQRWSETVAGMSPEWTVDQPLRVLQALQKDGQQNSLDLSISVDEKLAIMVKGNRSRFEHLIVYFTSNAFKKATSAIVEIRLVRNKEDISIIELKFQDGGPAMSECELDDTFNAFEQGQRHVKCQNEINGEIGDDIGVITRYVRALQGQIQVTSEMLKGTTFTVELRLEHAPSSDGSRARKFRNLFLSSNGFKGVSSTASMPPSMKPSKPFSTEMQRKTETTTPSEVIFTATTIGTTSQPFHRIASSGSSDHAPNIDDGAKGEPSLQSPDMVSRDSPSSPSQASMHNLNVLIAEDDPISLRALDERLSQWGHTVEIASNGQECYDRFMALSPSGVDVILMDLKMPSVDGTFSTKLIRFMETESMNRNKYNGQEQQSPKPRVPIIAVSASLFDGWLMKPIDFRRLDLLLEGVKTPKSRREALYTPGQWDKGGWFLP
ncbi:hypothetical protein BP5796_03884 [Coleophoma crateriformis]|uniref:Uncharacterized protein n=1 Tax=Coleophoma crateriformis TaxID=565419 RepID=A0A3D8SGT0_9HELO|nr:hypothetical protein BP5796_03884 [Coleophoma crateriformis]